MTFATQNRPSNFRLKRHLIVLAAVVTDDLKTLPSVVACGRLFGTAFRAALGSHHIALVKDLLFFFRKKKGFFTLNARGFDVRHINFSSNLSVKGDARILAQASKQNAILRGRERFNVGCDRST